MRKLPRHSHLPDEILSGRSMIPLDSVPQIDWARMAFDTWELLIGKLGGTAIDTAGDIAIGAINALGQITDNFFTGASGLAKFVAGFFTADDAGRGKFAELFVIEAMIDDLAVTNAKIKDLNAEKIITGYLAAARIEAGSIATSKLSIETHIVENLVISNNTPIAGYIEWTACTVYFDGTQYNVASSASGQKYIYWLKSNPNGFQESNSKPSLGIDDCLIAVNISGTGTRSVQRTYIHGGIIETNSISADDAVFKAAAILTADIGNLQVTEGKIGNLAVTNLKIANGTIEIAKVDSSFPRESFFKHNTWLVSMETLTGYTIDSAGNGSYDHLGKNDLRLYTTTTPSSGCWLVSTTKTVSLDFNPSFICRALLVGMAGSGAHIDFSVGKSVANKYFGFMIKESESSPYPIHAIWRNAGSAHTQDLGVTWATGETHIVKAGLEADGKIHWYIDGVEKYSTDSDIPTTGDVEEVNAAVYNVTSGVNVEIKLFNWEVTEDWQ